MPSVASNIPSPQQALNNYSSLNQLSMPTSFGGGISGRNLGSGLSFGPGGRLNSPQTTAFGQASGNLPTTPKITPAPAPKITPAPIAPKTPAPPTPQAIAAAMGTYKAPLPQAPTAPMATATIPSPFQVNPSTLPALSNPQNQSGSNYTAYNNNGSTSTYGNGGAQGAPQTPQPNTGGTTSFPGIVGGLVGAAQNGSAPAATYIQQTGQAGQGNLPIGATAADIAASYGKQIADTGAEGARFEGGELTGMGTSPVAQGNAAVTAQTTAAQQGALATGEEAALQGTGQELTAQNQAANAANAAAGQANTSQGLIQSGLTSAGELSAPGVANVSLGQGQNLVNAQGQTVSSTPVIAPVGTQSAYSVTPTSYTNGEPNANPTSQGYNIQSGDTFNALAGKYGTSTAALEAANPGVDPNNLQPGQRINIPGGGTSGNSPFTGGQAQGQAQLGEQWAQNNASIAKAQGVQQKIAQDITQNGINSLSSAQLVNFANDYVKGQLSDPNVQNFFNDLTDYTQTLAPMIGIGGSPTDAKNYLATQLVPQTSSGQSIIQIMDNLNGLATNSNNALLSAGQGTAPPGVNTPSGSTASQTTTVSGMSGSYYKDSSGMWHKS